jgi:hypothetical protein
MKAVMDAVISGINAAELDNTPFDHLAIEEFLPAKFAKAGNLKPHLDYATHPKLHLERRINLTCYLTDDYSDADGGHLGFEDNSSNKQLGKLVKEFAPRFNLAVIFNTSQNCWHGLSRKYKPAQDKFRKSLATYYLSEIRRNVPNRTRALFAPRAKRTNDESVEKQILLRANEEKYSDAYRDGLENLHSRKSE